MGILEQESQYRVEHYKRGQSRSIKPFRRAPPSWVKSSTEEISEKICKLRRKGHSPAQIGAILRDSHGIPLVKKITGMTILEILRRNGLEPDIPEDIYALIKRAVSIRKHLERNRKDVQNRHKLALTESKLYRLVKYHKRVNHLPPTWK